MKKVVHMAGFILPLGLILFCAFGFLFAPNDPNHVEVGARFAAASAEYPLGTDNMGRCTLSRLLYGGRTTLGVVLAGSLLVTGFGTVLGLLWAADVLGAVC